MLLSQDRFEGCEYTHFYSARSGWKEKPDTKIESQTFAIISGEDGFFSTVFGKKNESIFSSHTPHLSLDFKQSITPKILKTVA